MVRVGLTGVDWLTSMKYLMLGLYSKSGRHRLSKSAKLIKNTNIGFVGEVKRVAILLGLIWF